LTLHVPAQGAVALWGVNGAGKTTVIKCLLGLLRFDGRITVDGCDVQRQGRAARQRIGYVPQELAFYKEMTTYDMAEFYARLKGTPAGRIEPVLEQVGLANTRQAGRRAFGRHEAAAGAGLALLADPPVLVMDEPTSNLDTAARSQLLQLLVQVKQAGKTIIFTSHRIEEVETLATEVAVMERGRLRFAAPPLNCPRLGLRTQVKLLPGHQLDQALAVLQSDGFNGAPQRRRRDRRGRARREGAPDPHAALRADIEVSISRWSASDETRSK
jgi:ABC-type multidrug transport system ATPase subunit